ncbi:response regulator [Hyphomicrobium sp. 2TAF46]|uniref:response regulator n=1 Tax=Hyphomicrobium sp. 2TAF46 TaxID=3233019 RepID=UPI003F91AB23
MEFVLDFIETNKVWFSAAQAISSVVSLAAWCIAIPTVILLWRRGSLSGINLGPIGFQFRAAVEATAAADRAWKGNSPNQKVDIPRIQATLAPAFQPEIANNLIGKAVLWVDDNPANNRLGVRALRKLQLDVEQVESTEAALSSIENRHFDLIISDMGRGSNMRAGYDLLRSVRALDPAIPFFVFAGSDTPKFRREAAELGAQLSTNDMLELVDNVIKFLGREHK